MLNRNRSGVRRIDTGMLGEVPRHDRHLTSRKLVRWPKVDKCGNKAAGMIRPDLSAPSWSHYGVG